MLLEVVMSSRLLRPVLASFLLALGLHPEPATGQNPSGQASLYERLGGVYPIAVVVDAFIDALLVNETLNANPAIAAARERVPAPGLKYHVTSLVCQATGGPCRYTGRTMKAAHAQLNIREREWTAMVAEFRRILTRFNVPEREQAELITIVESTKPDIVVGGT
jgi:hemoglobin